MADIEAMYLKFFTRIAELEVLAHSTKHDNTRLGGQKRDRGPVDLETIDGDAWLTYFRHAILLLDVYNST
jgi:hypothetical protein